MESHRGGLTFVFTDIEGSTQLVRDLHTAYGLALRIHRRILESCFEEHGGREMGTEGDGLFFVFSEPAEALAAAVTAQHKIEHYTWPDGVRLRVRMGIHCGSVMVSGGEYVGLTVHQAARICAAAHGGQILCSDAVATDGAAHDLHRLGTYELRGIPEPTPLFQVVADGLDDDFPPLRDAVREGGIRISIWRRDTGPEAVGGPEDLVITPMADVVETEIRRASNGPGHAFRLIVRRNGVIEEEFDGLTIGGSTDAATVVNAHSRLCRIS